MLSVGQIKLRASNEDGIGLSIIVESTKSQLYKLCGNMLSDSELKNCCKNSKSGIFQLEESKIRDRKALERLYLVVALALLFATAHGMTVQLKGLRTQVDPHYRSTI